MEVKVVADVLLIDLDKVLVTFQVAEPANPASARLTVVIIVQLLYTRSSAFPPDRSTFNQNPTYIVVMTSLNLSAIGFEFLSG